MLTKTLSYLDALVIAYGCAANSLDPSTQTGAILVDRARGPIVRSHNQFARGLERTAERDSDRDEKLRYTVHAEASAILLAAREGIRTDGLILVCPWAACTECAKAIIQSGIIEVVAHKQCMEQTPARWADDIYHATRMMEESGVKYTLVTGVVGRKIRFDGKDVEF